MMLRRHFGPTTAPGYRVALMPATEDFSIKVRHSIIVGVAYCHVIVFQAVDWTSAAFTGHHKYELSYQLLQVHASLLMANSN